MASLGLWLCGTSPRWELNHQLAQIPLKKKLLPRRRFFLQQRLPGLNGSIFVKTAVGADCEIVLRLFLVVFFSSLLRGV